ncbi:MAG: acyl-CoA dehydrogenase, partial [Sphingomonadaceae bacterium]
MMATALTADAPTDPLDAFRAEARDWLEQHFPKALAHKDGGMSAVEGPHDPTPDEAAWTKAMGEKG